MFPLYLSPPPLPARQSPSRFEPASVGNFTHISSLGSEPEAVGKFHGWGAPRQVSSWGCTQPETVGRFHGRVHSGNLTKGLHRASKRWPPRGTLGFGAKQGTKGMWVIATRGYFGKACWWRLYLDLNHEMSSCSTVGPCASLQTSLKGRKTKLPVDASVDASCCARALL